jgi:hypothetical protein
MWNCKDCEGWDKQCIICCECWDRNWPSTPEYGEGCKFQCKHGSYCNLFVCKDSMYESCKNCNKTLCEAHLESLDYQGHCLECRINIENSDEESEKEERKCSYFNCENKRYISCIKCQSYHVCRDHKKALFESLCDQCRCPLPKSYSF